METPQSNSASIRIALEGCGHGCLHDIYASVAKAASLKGWDGVDLLIIGGDFQAVRNSNDLACMSVPQKYKELGDFHEYYSGQRTAPYLTVFIGGNHEASNHLFELYYGGWAAPNIYYLGAANVLRCGPLRIAGMSGIWKGYDYRKPHFERIPYNRDDIHSIYHIRELDVRKLLQIRTQVDLGLSHDWPSKVEYSGDYERLFRTKKGFREDSQKNKLGSQAAKYVLDRLRPAYWFSAHLHVRFTASIQHLLSGTPGQPNSMEPVSTPQHNRSRTPATSYTFGLDGAVFTSILLGDEQQENQSSTIISDSSHDAATDQPPQTVEGLQQSNHGDSNMNDENQRIGQYPQDTTQQLRPENVGLIHDETKTTESKLSAWQNFHETAARNEANDNDRFLLEQEKSPTRDVEHNLTWRKIDVDEDGVGRKLTGIEKSGYTPEAKKQKTRHDLPVVKNSDEIDLDLDSDSDVEQPAQSPTPKPTKETTNLPEESPKDQQTNKVTVSEDLRSQLPASFSRPQPAAAPVNEPFPEAISNKTTDFLALDKCLPNRDFLQLVEFKTVSDLGQAQFERPFRLQYDKEWLAVTRVFTQDLHLGDPSAKPSPDKGNAVYKPLIIEEEKWIEENVVKPGKLTVPENFIPTAPFYDPSVPITTEDAPPEYNNPQTAAFCKLIGIENKFHLSDEEREARMAAGPRPCNDRGGNMNRYNGPGRRGGFSGRGHGGGGRGRGGYGRGYGRGGGRH